MNKTETRVTGKTKDTVFRMLFKDRKNLLALYNAVNKTAYTNENELEIVTLENAIYMTYKNDLAFLIDDYMYLYEHQSTYNPNMPLRNLFYIAAEYQRLTNMRAIYSSVLQKLPTPRFLVFYNGLDHTAEHEILKLSDAFMQPLDPPELELVVTLLNINEGHNRELMEQCRLLKEYAAYVAKLRKYALKLPTSEAVELAVDECIAENILTDFLRENKSEVIGMSIFEYDEAKEMKLIREAERGEGEQLGYEKGEQSGLKRGLKKGEQLGEQRMASLTEKLLASGRFDDLKKMTADPEYRKSLYQEYGI